ncbi:hypothetical protein TNCV_1930571 [Trichonephila clavipes]|nr:hypothetical protein TNCV_1930571 [Trichonephila clavipes]
MCEVKTSEDFRVPIGKVACCDPQLILSIGEEDVHSGNLAPQGKVQFPNPDVRSSSLTYGSSPGLEQQFLSSYHPNRIKISAPLSRMGKMTDGGFRAASEKQSHLLYVIFFIQLWGNVSFA